MKTIPPRLLLATLVLVTVAPAVRAQQPAGERKGPVAKLYIADSKGDAHIAHEDDVQALSKSTAFDAPGSLIETKPDGYTTLVFSNGTGLYVGGNSRVQIDRFEQQPFQARGTDALNANQEPSVSHINLNLSRGAIGLCTSRLLAGSTLTCATPLAGLDIAGGKVAVEILADETHVDLLEGSLVIGRSDKDAGQILQAGERAVIRAAATAGGTPAIKIMPIPEEAKKTNDQRVASGCASRRSVTFEALAASDEAAGAGDQEIVVRPIVPDGTSSTPSNIVISPDRLPGT